MIKYIATRFFGWMDNEPFIGLMMVIAAIVLFLSAYKMKGESISDAFWPWMRRILEAVGIAILFLGLLWAFRAVLNNNSKTFRNSHGRVSAANYQSLKTIWGAPHVQRELNVYHYIKKRVREEVPRPDPSRPPIYRYVMKDVLVEQNTIVGVRGDVKMKMEKRKKGSAYYSTYALNFYMEYDVINDSRHKTNARFYFPLQSGQVQFRNLEIMVNNKDQSRNLRVARTGIRWIKVMKPGEKQKIVVRYETRGVEQFYYQIPNAREIRNFYFKLTVDKLPIDRKNYPQGCLSPDKVSASPDGNGTVFEWKLDRAITSAGMGVALPKPEQPGAKVTMVLNKSPYALMLLIVSICLTLLILGEKVNFLEISLLSAVYMLLFITMASISDFFMGFWGSLVFGSLLTLGLAFLMYRKHDSKLLKTIILTLVGFFTLIYPLAGLFPDYQASFDGVVMIGLIVYLFWISLFVRIRERSAET